MARGIEFVKMDVNGLPTSNFCVLLLYPEIYTKLREIGYESGKSVGDLINEGIGLVFERYSRSCSAKGVVCDYGKKESEG